MSDTPDFLSKPGQVDLLRTMAEGQGTLRSTEEMDRTLNYLRGSSGRPDNFGEAALKWLGYPGQLLATGAAKVLAPQGSEDFTFAIPESSEDQRTFFDLGLRSAGYERGDFLRTAGGTVAGLAGLGLDILADPLNFLKVGTLTKGAAAMRMGLHSQSADLIRAATRGVVSADLPGALRAGQEVYSTKLGLSKMREALQAGAEVIPTPEHVAKGVAAGKPQALKEKAGIDSLNRTLRELEKSGWLGTPEAEKLAEGMVSEVAGQGGFSSARRTSLGGGRLVSLSRNPSDPGNIERAIAGAIAPVGEAIGKVTRKLGKALGAVETRGVLGLMVASLKGQQHIDDSVMFKLAEHLKKTVFEASGETPTPAQMREFLDLIEAPLSTDPHAYAVLSDLRAFMEDKSRYDKLAAKAKDTGARQASGFGTEFGRDHAYYSHKGLKKPELEEVLRGGQTGDVALSEGRRYTVLPVDDEGSVAATSFYNELKGLPGLGQAGVSKDRVVVRRLLGEEVPPGAISPEHFDQLQRVLALAARKQWGLAPGRPLEGAVAFSSHGTLQVVDPTAFVQLGSVQEALEASHAAATDFVQRIAPRTRPTLDILADPNLAARVKADVRPSLLTVAENLLPELSPTAAKSVRFWDRGDLASAIDNPLSFSPETVKAVAAHLTKEGQIPPVRITVDPNTNKVLVADEASAKVLAAAEFLERAQVPVQRVPWVGEKLGRVRAAKDVLVPEAQGVEISRRLESLSEHGIGGQEAVVHLRGMGVSEQAVEVLRTARFVNDAGDDLLTLQGVSAQLEKATVQARAQVAAALSRMVKDPLRVESMLANVFKPAGQGFDIDHSAMTAYLGVLGDKTSESANIHRALGRLTKQVDNLHAFLLEGSPNFLNPAVLGVPRAYAVRPMEGVLKLVPLGAAPTPDYAAVGLNAGARLANRHKLHPLTQLEVARHPLDPGVVRGPGQRLPLSAMGNDPTLEKAVMRLDEEEIKSAISNQKTRFQVSEGRRAELEDLGVEIDPKDSTYFKDRRIPDTEIHSGIILPGGTHIYGHGIGETAAIEEMVFGTVPHRVQEWFRADQSGIHIYNTQWGIFEGLHQPQVDLLNDRLRDMAQRFLRAGHFPDKEMVFAKYVPMDATMKRAIYGDLPPTLQEVADGTYKVKIPDGWEGRVMDLAEPSAGGVVTVRGTSDTTVQKMVSAWRQVVQTDLATSEVLEKLMLPSSLRYGYFARILSPEGRKAVDAWFEAVAMEQPQGVGGKLYAYLNQHYGKRSITQLSTNEVNDLFDSGKLLHEGRAITREDLLKVKTKSGTTLGKALEKDPEALSYFVTDAQDALLLRVMAGQKSIRNAQFIDSLRGLAMEVLPGQKEIPLAEARKLVARSRAGEELTEREQQVVNLLTKPGEYRAVITRHEAQKLAADGQLDADMLKPLEGGAAMLEVEGRLFEHPRWKGGSIRFMPREVLAEMNRTYTRLTNVVQLNALAAGFHGVQNMWKRMALFTVPKFYTRNIIGDMLLAWQGGLHPLDVKTHSEAFGALLGYRQYTRFGQASLEPGELVLKTGGKAERGTHPLTELTLPSGVVTYEQEIEAANANGVFHGVYARQLHRQLNDTLKGRGISSINDMPLDTPFSNPTWGKPIEGVIERGVKLHEGVENHFRFAVYLKNRKDGKTVTEAANIAKKVLGGTQELTPLEKTVGAAVFPFYRWLRFNIPRQVAWHIERPDQALKMWRAMEIVGRGGADVPEDELPEWAKKNFSVTMGKKDGQWSFLTANGLIPAVDVLSLYNTFADPGEQTTDALLTGMSPFIRTPYEAFSGRKMTGEKLETVPGELSEMAFRGMPGLTKRATTAGPAGPLNLVWNEQTFNLLRPLREASQFLGLFHKPDQEMGERLRNLLLLKVSTSDPLKQQVLHQQDRQRVFGDIKARYRAALREGNESKQRYWLGQLNAHAVWSVPR
jgi:hypothetical protein